MARTRFDGPLYGARGILLQVYKDSVDTGQTDLEIFEIAVPADEDWYVDRVHVYCDARGSAADNIDVEDAGTTILSGNVTLVADADTAGTLSSNPYRIAASNAVTVDATTGNTSGAADITVTVEGWRRYIAAPRGRTNPLGGT